MVEDLAGTDVLIIEDSPITRDVEMRALSKAGFSCRAARDIRQAWQRLEERRPDLVIQDHELPDGTGLDMIRRMLARWPDLLVVMVTGRGDERLVVEAMRAAARDYVPKMGDFTAPLVHVVRRVLREDQVRRELDMRVRETERLTAQNELTFWLSHNFRNLFSGAMGFLQLIDIDDDQSRETRLYYKDHALDSLKRAMTLVDRLLDLTDLTPRPAGQVLLGKLVGESHDRARSRVEGVTTSARFENRIAPGMELEISERDLRLVLECLLQNALEAAVPEGRIVVTAERRRDVLVLRVEDTGRGMDPEVLKSAAGPMFTTKNVVGAGLGLSMANAALRRNGGRMELISAPDRGTAVLTYWPLGEGQP